MIVKAKVNLDVDLASLAEALARKPEDFAAFWFLFAKVVEKEHIDLEPHGEAMAPVHGGMRKHPFTAVLDYMRYHERKQGQG